MEKFNELNLCILDDDGSANLQNIMRDILKEIVKEQEENKKKGIILPQPHSGTAGSIKHTAINKTATQSLAGRESTISEEPIKHSDN